MNTEISTSRRLAPEDIVPGIFIAITSRIREVYPYWLLNGIAGQQLEVAKFSCMGCGDGSPLRVVSTCLPFVMTENARGEVAVIDARMCGIVQVDEMFALELFTRPGRFVCQCRE